MAPIAGNKPLATPTASAKHMPLTMSELDRTSRGSNPFKLAPMSGTATAARSIPRVPPTTEMANDSPRMRNNRARSGKPTALNMAISPVRSRTDIAMVLPVTRSRVKKTTQAGFKVISHAAQFDRTSFRQTSGEDFIIDLFALSQCRSIVGSGESNVLRAAAYIGGQRSWKLAIPSEAQDADLRLYERGREITERIFKKDSEAIRAGLAARGVSS